MSTAYTELKGSPVERWSNASVEDSVVATRRLKCVWADRYALLNELLANGGASYEHHSSGLYVRAKSASAIPFPGSQSSQGAVSTVISYSHAEVTVQYGVADFDSSDDLFSETIEPVSEMVTLDHTKFRWKTGDAEKAKLTPEEAPVKPYYSVNYVFTRYGLSSVPAHALALMNHVNSSEVLASSWGIVFSPDTLLFGQPNITRRVLADLTTRGFDITYRMAYNPRGWNSYFRADIQDYDTLINRRTGEDHKNFPEGYFGSL